MDQGGAEAAATAERRGLAAAAWLLREQGPAQAEPTLYHGQAGVMLALHEAHAHTGDPAYAEAVEQGADALSARVPDIVESGLYFGLTGVAFALHSLGRLGDATAALRVVRDRAEDGRWGPMFELFAGNAGIGLGALAVGDLDLALDAVTPYVASATPTRDGVSWAVRPAPARSHHLAHGTLGIVQALATIGAEADRADLVELAVRGAADVVGRNERHPDGFLVPHSDPPHRPELVERYSLGWCNGPAGDAQVFRLLARATGDEEWARLADRCWHTVTTSGLPTRLRPGFWDNNGRCCGTAGVLALAADRVVESDDSPDFGDLLVADLAARATLDDEGARWSNVEHRATPAALAPRPGWAMGNAGILRELLRWSRIRTGRPPAYAVAWPDHPVATH